MIHCQRRSHISYIPTNSGVYDTRENASMTGIHCLNDFCGKKVSCLFQNVITQNKRINEAQKSSDITEHVST